MDKRPADGVADASVPVSKRGRWDSGPGSAAGATAAAPAAPPGAAAPLTAAGAAAAVPVAAAASAAALAAAVAAKYAQPPTARPPAPGAPPSALPSGAAAAAVAQAAAAALQRLPTAAAAALQPPAGAPTAAAGATPAAAAAGAAPGGARPPSISLDALEKAKRALQLQKEIQEKLKSRQLAAKLAPPAGGPPAAAAAGAAGAGAANGSTAGPSAVPSSVVPVGVGAAPGPRPLLVPGSATPSIRPPPPTSGLASLLPRQAALAPPVLLPPPEPEVPPEDPRFVDPVLGSRGAGARKGERRRRAGFDFVHEGRYQHEAEVFRLKAHLGSAAFRKGARVSGPLGNPNQPLLPLSAASGVPLGDANLVPLGTRQDTGAPAREATPAPVAEPVPAVEWWDRGLMAHASLDQDVPELPAEVTEAMAAAAAGKAKRRSGTVGGSDGGGQDAEMEEAAADQDGDRGAEAAEAAAGMEVEGEQDGGAPPGEEEEARRVRMEAAAAAVEAAARAAAAGELGPFQLKEARLTLYVEHPVPLDPPAEAPPPPPQPLKLTAKELKKLRTQRRLARDKEKQELIRQGLLEPPKPKVRIANLHRVLGTDAAADPTAIEKEVRKQMAERQAAHEDRNLARKLTPAERRDKKLRKLFGSAAVESGAAEVGGKGGPRGGAAAAAATAAGTAAGVDVTCSVFRVGRLTDPQHRFKVDANARENHMTGMSIISDDFCVVVVEGVEKATRRYTKLMMRRIDWATAPAALPGAPGGAAAGRAGGRDGADHHMGGDDEGEEEEEDKPPPNVCTLVWQGTVLKRAFVGFRSETVRSAAAGRQLLEDLGVGHYWDAAANAAEGESVPFSV